MEPCAGSSKVCGDDLWDNDECPMTVMCLWQRRDGNVVGARGDVASVDNDNAGAKNTDDSKRVGMSEVRESDSSR